MPSQLSRVRVTLLCSALALSGTTLAYARSHQPSLAPFGPLSTATRQLLFLTRLLHLRTPLPPSYTLRKAQSLPRSLRSTASAFSAISPSIAHPTYPRPLCSLNTSSPPHTSSVQPFVYHLSSLLPSRNPWGPSPSSVVLLLSLQFLRFSVLC